MQAGTTIAPATRIEIQLTNGVRVFVPISDSETVENTISIASRLSESFAVFRVFVTVPHNHYRQALHSVSV